MSNLLLSVREAAVHYGEKTVFEDLSFNIHDGARIALVGRNGAGKTTLMNIITGRQAPDAGERWQAPGLTVGYLRQDIAPGAGQTVFDYIFSEIKDAERALHAYKVEMVAGALELDAGAPLSRLSGGQLRRAGLARALVEEPDILLLDEPTNHLDLGAIEWLEGYLRNYRGALLCVSHDRAFLSNVTRQVFWLDRGSLRVSPRGFAYFGEWSEMMLEQEERELKNRRQAVAQEVEWASRGVKARRKRNLRRLEEMRRMRDRLRADEAAFRRATRKINTGPIQEDEMHGRTVAEFYKVSKSFAREEGALPILSDFSLRIQRGDRIGILGRNGSGKTTFLKLLLGELVPDRGSVKRRKDMEFSYFDQQRSLLDPAQTLKRTLSPAGGDYIDVMGKQRHVCGYLKDFMFDPRRADDKVAHLSGGQKNRLMLARVLASPKNCLILDEPTNDLDMETLDMLEEILSQYKGTLVVVSHDRDFLDQTVTRILAFEGEGRVESCVGGYSDYLAWKNARGAAVAPSPAPASAGPEKAARPAPAPRRRLTYKLEYELERLPGKIAAAQEEAAAQSARLADADFYARDPEGFHAAVQALAAAKARLERYEARWLELEEMKEALGEGKT